MRASNSLPMLNALCALALLQVKTPEESHADWDLAKVVATIPANKAFRPLAQSECPLVKH